MTDALELGIITPVFSLYPHVHAEWERHGTIHDVRRIAQAADELGYHFLTCSEHVAVPKSVEAGLGSRYWDPLASLGYLAAHTSRIRLATFVLVLGYHHPLEIAKQYGTLDRISGGRVILGVGAGYLQEEFELLGASFEDRGARGDDALRAIRASLGRSEPAYQGPFYSFGGMVVEPTALQERVPLWVGGRTRRSLRRAIEHADGWAPFGLAPDEIASWLSRAAATDAWHCRSEPFAVVLPGPRPLDPSGDRQGALEALRAARDAGATGMSLRFVHHSVEHYIEQLEAMMKATADL